MKTTILLLLISVATIAQTKKPIYTMFKNGVGKEVRLTVSFSDSVIPTVRADTSFIKWKKDEMRKIKDPKLLSVKTPEYIYLLHTAYILPMYLELKLKNGTSMDFVPDSELFIYEVGGKITYSFPFTAQNNIGNTLTKKAIIKHDTHEVIITD